MNKVDRLVAEFESVAARPWSATLAGPQRVWMVVYDETDERRVRAYREAFTHAGQKAGHALVWCDLTDVFGEWMANQRYRESYFKSPELLSSKGPLTSFRKAVTDTVREHLASADDTSIVGLTGVGSLFGLIRVSEVLDAVHGDIQGRLAVFFPGVRNVNTYRLLDARDGWSYLAVPIPG